MGKTLIIIIIVMFASCYGPNTYDVLYNFKCTTDQMKKVVEETTFCRENVPPLEKKNCYPTAISRNCKRFKNKNGEEK